MSPRTKMALGLLELMEKAYADGFVCTAKSMMEDTRLALKNIEHDKSVNSRFHRLTKNVNGWYEAGKVYDDAHKQLLSQLPTAEQYVLFLESSYETGFTDIANSTLDEARDILSQQSPYQTKEHTIKLGERFAIVERKLMGLKK